MEYVRRLLQALRVTPSNEARGRSASLYPPTDDEAGRPSFQSRRQKAMAPELEKMSSALNTSDRLLEFRMLLGIISHGSFEAPEGFGTKLRPAVTKDGRPAPNEGIYPAVSAKEWKAKRTYKRYQIAINTALGFQLVLSAAITALGASNSSHSTITGFGAINTVCAGFLTYLKGSGVPQRFKYYASEWKQLREYIEQRERDIGVSSIRIDIHKEVGMIREMYAKVTADVESNTPDRYVSATPLKHPPLGLAADSAIPKEGDYPRKEIDDLSEGSARVVSSIGNEARRTIVVSEKEAAQLFSDRAKQMGDLEKEVETSVGGHARDFEQQVQTSVGGHARNVEQQVQTSVGGHARDLEHGVEAPIIQARDSVNHAFDLVAHARNELGHALANDNTK